MLEFHFGVMGSGKSAFALMTYHQRHTPDSPHHPNTAALATTFDRSLSRVTSRTGMHSPALVIAPGTVSPERFHGIDTLVIDEAQFLTAGDVEVLADLAAGGTEVLCFGLRTDFTSHLFDGSRRLLELADRVIALPMAPRCARCHEPALINARLVDGVVTDRGDTVVLGDVAGANDGPEPVYDPMCWACWRAVLATTGAGVTIDLRSPVRA